MRINGFIVVLLPELNVRFPNGVIPCVNGVYYAGIDRQRWIDVFDEDFYSKKSPEAITDWASAVRSANDFSGIDLCQDEAIGKKLLRYSNRKAVRNELIAIRSPALNLIKGTIEVQSEIEWIGFDFVAFGEWSLIASGLFMYPDHYSGWLSRINRFGLFKDLTLFSDYNLEYDRAVREGRSEPLAPKTAGFENIAIQVGRPKH